MTTPNAALADALSEHFPTGLRSARHVIAGTSKVIEGPVRCECMCGACFAGTDEQEVRQLWAEHVSALRARAASDTREDGE